MSGQDPRAPGTVDELAAGRERAAGSLSPWFWRIAALLVMGVVAVVVGPDLLSSPSPRDDALPPSPTAQVVVTPPPPAVLPLSWALRGPAATSVFAERALARLRADRPDVDRLLWAGSLDGRDQVALVAYRPTAGGYAGGGVEVGALRLATGDDFSAAEIESIGNVRDSSGMVGLAWQGTDRRVRLLVLARPGPMQVQVSSSVDYAASGRISRQWRDESDAEGAAVIDLGRRVDPLIVVRPKDRNSATSAFLVDVRGRPAPDLRDVHVDGLSAESYAGPPADVLVKGLATAVSQLFDLRDAQARVLWSGALPGGRSDTGEQVSGRAALVLVHRRDGPVFQSFVFSDPSGNEVSYSAYAVPWSVADRLPYVFSTYTQDAPLMLINPRGVGSVTLSPIVGEPRTYDIGHSGVAVVASSGVVGPAFSGGLVVVRDRAGRTVLRSHLVDPGTVDPFGLYL